MADVGEEEEYESDPEQAKLSLAMRRRREASDDEEEVDDDEDDVRVRGRARVIDSRVSDYESDDQGAAAEYDDEEEYDLAEEEELLEEVEHEEAVQGRGRSEVQGVRNDLDGVIEGSSVGVKKENDQTDGDGLYAPESVDQFDDNANGTVGDGDGEGEGGQEEKKENEPFQVPTAGAFYMHDDRFRDSSGGRHRRTLGGRKLWELRDDRKWGHDKFEEMSMQERHYDEGRRAPRGRNRGARGRNRGEDRNFAPGNRPKTYNNNNNNNQNNASKSVRGRGPRKYQPSSQNNFEPPSQNRQPAKQMEKTGNANSGRTSTATSASESTQVPTKKNILGSNLNSASPPFYPSGNKETNMNQKKESQTVNRRENYPVSQSNNNNNNNRGRSVSDSLNMDKLYIDDSGPSFINPPQRAYQQVPHHQQVNRVTSPNNQVHSFQRPPALNQLHPNLQNPGQQFGQRSASGSRASSPPKEPTETESPTESNESKTAIVGKGKGSIQTGIQTSIQTGGMTSFPYHGDQNFPGAPTFLSVMQFAGQHPGGLGVPAVGMAFPGYVAQPNGMGNSEMTWLPVLAGAAGALGAAGAYCSPYITMDGAYHARPSGQTSALPPTSKESNTNKTGTEVKPSQRPEVANDEMRQRQTKARRYTEMKFDK